MSTNHTANYNLSQWEPTDQVLRADFNEDNAKIDAALKAAADARSALATSRNCQACVVTYRGTGKVGSSTPNEVTFPHKPLFIQVQGDPERSFAAVRGVGNVMPLTANTTDIMREYITWEGNTVRWYATATVQTPMHPEFQLNSSGQTYYVFAILELED